MDYSKIKIIFYDSTIIAKNDILWGLLELGFDVTRSTFRTEMDGLSDQEIETIKKEIEGYHYAVTQNFCVNVAEACYQKGIPYISWVYDSPLVTLFRKEALYPTNFIFAFDRKQVERIRAIGCNNIFYQPLAANMAITSMLNITDEDVAKYESDISFVGQIYEQDFFGTFLSKASKDVKNDVSRLFSQIGCNWGKGISPLDYLSEETINCIDSYIDKSYVGTYSVEKRFLAEVLLIIPPLAGYERKKTLQKCGEHFRTSLYTNTDLDVISGWEEFKNVKLNPKVNYDDEMYKVFYASKINLNLTLRSIETGIPQRIFDIMSVGGPVFTNYQEEAEELFVPDKEIVLFRSLEELRDKADYYLRHDNERVRLGINGYYRVRDEYNYTESLKKMFSLVETRI